MFTQWRITVLGLALFSTVSHARAEVRVVDASGHGDYSSIGAAVAAAQDGDLLLVRSGTYAGFTVGGAIGSSIAIAEDAGATVLVLGTVNVSNLPSSASFVLSGIEVRGPVSVQGSGPALILNNAYGHVRISDCTLIGGDGSPNSGFNWKPGADALDATTAFDVALMRCTILGGKGAGSLPDQGFFDFGAKGGDAVRARFTAATLSDCIVRGGDGGGGEGAGGNGGRGYDHDQGGGGAMFSGCTIEGGDGGYAHGYGIGGVGGHALFTSTAAHHHLLDDVVIAGAGGQSTGYNPGASGQSFAGTGTYETFSGSARRLASAGLAPSGGMIEVSFTGEAGDRLYVAQSQQTDFHFRFAGRGVWLLPSPSLFEFTPATTLATTGTVSLTLPIGSLPSGQLADTTYLQGLVFDAAGLRVITTLLVVQRLGCAVLTPDCDGDGSFDTCQILATQALDTNHDGVLDACEPDCNQNGLPDGVEITQGLVPDVNHDGTPDPCEPPQVIHVDAAAAPFGNGSAQSPFRTLREAVSSAIDGDTVLLAAGTYSGPDNRDIDLGTRDLVIRGTLGASVCTIDGQNFGRIFSLHSGENATFEGLTFRNGKPGGDSFGYGGGGGVFAQVAGVVTIRGCVFKNCHATQGGGGVYSQQCTMIVQDCVFTDNGDLTTFSPGGALRCSESGPLLVRHCTFTGNKGSVGGAILASSSAPSLIEACDFRGNQAAVYGGGLVCTYSTIVHGCLIAGNSAPKGGGLVLSQDARVSQCTLVANSSSQRGGGVYLNIADGPGSAPIRLHDSIVWGNTAPAGAQIASETTFNDTIEVRSCDVQGGPGAVSMLGGTFDWNGTDFDLDPAFALPAGADGDPLTLGDNDWRLSLASPCIDSGDNGLVTQDLGDLDDDGDRAEPTPLDLDLAPRFSDVASVPDTGIGTSPLTDRGAYERPN